VNDINRTACVGRYWRRLKTVAGIVNYYHGESGTVVERGYALDEEERTFVLRLEGDPHRELAYDYGSDIGIDPLLQLGAKAVFLRIDTYAGIWVREQDLFYPDLERAIGRVVSARDGDRTEPRVTDETVRRMGAGRVQRPATEASFFLSFSSENVLVARQIFEDLRDDTKVEVWFDLDQQGESPKHSHQVERWLKEAVYTSRGFILLWSKAAKGSSWVRREIQWATEKATHDRDFHFVVLKIDGESVPVDLIDAQYVIDCHDLDPINGVNEELFAAVTRRPGRVAWAKENQRRGFEIEKDHTVSGYEPFASDSGVAITLRRWEENGDLHWELAYEKDRRLHKVRGRGEERAVDLGIKAQDYVGYFVCRRNLWGIRWMPGIPVWMRSQDLNISPEEVVAAYRQEARAITNDETG
jgi:TIR domain-containing protein